jgi:hemerythrin-like metal-binding protein
MGIRAEERSSSPAIQPSIAEEHRLLAEQVDLASLEIDKFFSEPAKRSPSDIRRLVHILGDFIETAEAHFYHEEGLMKKDGYPGLFLHKRDHDDLLKRLNRFASSLSGGRLPVPGGRGADLQSWLAAHTKKFDDPYIAFAEARSREAGE